MASLAFVLQAALPLVSTGVRAADDPAVPSKPRMQFVPTPAGTYRLQRIQSCPDAWLLDASGARRRLSSVTRGKITLLTFFYTYCTDPLGCPFALDLMRQLRDRLLTEPALAARVRFVSVSFDPAHDAPSQLRRFARGVASDGPFEWDFLTAESMPTLQPLLEQFGQDVGVEHDDAGRPTRAIHHMLKLFLVDEAGDVREIYALDFLQPEVMLNDIRTLRLEAPPRAQSAIAPGP